MAVKFKTEVTLNFAELFAEAERRLGWSWNKCCNIFHRGEIICSPESPNIGYGSVDEYDYWKEKAEAGDEKAMAYVLIAELLKENNFTNCKIITT